VVLSLVAAGPGCGGNDVATTTSAAPLTLREGQNPPGTYEVDVGPGVVLRIGSGWSSHHPGPGFFDVHRPTPGGQEPGTPGWEVALLFLEPRAADAEELAEGIRENGLRVAQQVHTTLGGLDATRIDVAPSHAEQELFDFGDTSVGGFAGRRYRIWAITSEDRLLTVVLDTPAKGSADVELAEAVLATVRFGAGT
jgi:hypothetical protein